MRSALFAVALVAGIAAGAHGQLVYTLLPPTVVPPPAIRMAVNALPSPSYPAGGAHAVPIQAFAFPAAATWAPPLTPACATGAVTPGGISFDPTIGAAAPFSVPRVFYSDGASIFVTPHAGYAVAGPGQIFAFTPPGGLFTGAIQGLAYDYTTALLYVLDTAGFVFALGWPNTVPQTPAPITIAGPYLLPLALLPGGTTDLAFDAVYGSLWVTDCIGSVVMVRTPAVGAPGGTPLAPGFAFVPPGLLFPGPVTGIAVDNSTDVPALLPPPPPGAPIAQPACTGNLPGTFRVIVSDGISLADLFTGAIVAVPGGVASPGIAFCPDAQLRFNPGNLGLSTVFTAPYLAANLGLAGNTVTLGHPIATTATIGADTLCTVPPPGIALGGGQTLWLNPVTAFLLGTAPTNVPLPVTGGAGIVPGFTLALQWFDPVVNASDLAQLRLAL